MIRIKKLRSSLPFNVISAIVVLLLVFGAVAGALGLINFADGLRREYAVTTFHMADTAATLVNGDHLEDYLKGERTDEYQSTRENLELFCRKISVSLIYVIQVDRSDYGSFVSVFNLADNSVDNSDYVPWELGYTRETTNDEYRQKYRAVCEEGSAYETVYRLHTTDGQHPHITTIVPVKNSAGEVCALLCMQRPARELADYGSIYVINIVASIAFISILAGAVATRFLRRKIIQPIQKVSEEATRFAEQNIKGEPLEDISRYEDFAKLASSIDTMETDIVRHVEEETRIAAEKEKILTELTLAKEIQAQSIPQTFPPFPDRTEFSLYASMTPARGVGGDFYNFIMVDDDHLALLIADVSGKGIPGALCMMVSNMRLLQRTYEGGSPAEILGSVNEWICRNNKTGMFVTVWLGILELSTGKLKAANAGHEYPAIQRKGELFELFKDRHGLVLGGMEGVSYKDYELQLNPGDKLFVYTDGVPEATNRGKKMFGTERMLAALSAEPDASPEKTLANVSDAVKAFVKEAEQFDDLTMMCLEYRG
ncbi:MAG: PP2C family protein-serine/threonine phosphatase [Clostridia bacterium]|nr:PP2C family protein-serine/threonine phosphatase [Clostridia bacterium]